MHIYIKWLAGYVTMYLESRAVGRAIIIIMVIGKKVTCYEGKPMCLCLR